MKRPLPELVLAACAAACAIGAALAPQPASASTAATAITVEHGWVRWLPAGLPAAGYVVIRNGGGKPLELTGADSADYGMAMLHRSMRKDGKDTMQRVDAIAVPAHGSVALSPGGYHLMLMNPKHAIAPGDSVHLSLHFSDGETLQATWPVRPANASGG